MNQALTENLDILASSAAAHQVVIIDANVADAAALAAAAPAGARVFILDGASDGVAQVGAILQSVGNVDSVHLVGHGGDGYFLLGSEVVSADTAGHYAGAFQSWSAGLNPGADLLFYGCDVAASAAGQALLGKIGQWTGADVAASTNLSGIHGDWVLEYRQGTVETPALAGQGYQHDLIAVAPSILMVTTLDDEISSGGTLAAEQADGTGLSLREALAQAKGNGQLDTIMFAPSLFADGKMHTITLTHGELDIKGTSDADGLNIVGVGSSLLTISGNNTSRVFYSYINSNVKAGTPPINTEVTISGLTMTDGNGGANAWGGAIGFYNSGNLSLDHVVIQDSVGKNGGGLFFGSQVAQTLSITNSTIAGNSLNTLTGSGGGIGFYTKGNVDIVGSTINDNTAGKSGGGIDTNAKGTVNIINTTLDGNHAGGGGTNGNGGAFSHGNNAGVTNFINSTITNNTQGNTLATGTGLGAGLFFNSGTVNLVNNLFANNTTTNSSAAGINGADLVINGTGTAAGSNNIIVKAAGTGSNTLTGSITTVPTLGALADNGGPVQTHAISAGVAVGAGATTGTGIPSVDANGFVRGPSIDIGAYEYSNTGVFQFTGSLFPPSGYIYVPTGGNLSLDFGRSVAAVAAKDIIIHNADGSVFETIPASDARVGIAGDVVTLNPTAELVPGHGYYITIDAGAFTAAGGTQVFAGLSGSSAWSFTADPTLPDTTPPAPPGMPDLADASDHGALNSDNITNLATPTFTGTGEEGATVTLYEGTTVLGSDVVSGGNWSITSSTLTEGIHTVRAGATDVAGNIGDLSAGLDVTIDTTAPTVASINIAGAATTGAASVDYTVTFSESVTGVDITDFALNKSGNANGTIASITGSGTTYTVTVNTVTGDGALRLDLNGVSTGIIDTAGNAIAATGHTGDQSYTIDHTGPTVGSVGVPSNNTYSTGASLDFTVNFNEAVTVTGTPRIAIVIDGPTTVYADYVSGGGGSALVFRYTVANGHVDGDGVALAGAIDLHGGTLKDASGNNATLALNGVGALTGVLVNGIAPEVSSISLVNAATNNLTSVDYTVVFSSAVSNVDAADFVLTGSGVTGHIAAVNGGGDTYTVTVDTLAGNGTLRLDLKGSGTGIVDGASNPIGAGYNAGPAYTIDHAAPTIASVAAPSNATYKSGDQLDFTVNFNEAVTVNSGGGTPSITVTLGNGATAQAHYLSGSGGSALTFRYIVGAGDIDADGLSLASAIALNGGTLKDGAGNDAALTLHGVGALTGILVDGAAPTVASINIAGAATTGASSVDYTVTFSESVTGVDITDFALNKSGNANGTIASITGSGTTYTVTVNTVTGDGALRLDLNGASTGIIDTAGNAIATTGHTGDQAYTVDHTGPTVGSVGVPSNNTYSTGASLDFTVNFNEAVTVTGTPRIAIVIDGPTTVYSDYVSGGGGSTLVFRYTVANGHVDGDGVALAGAIDLHGGTLKDASGNNATLALNGVGALTGVLVNGIAPEVSSISLVNAATNNLTSVDYTVVFSSAVTNVDAADFVLTGSGVTGHIAAVNGGGDTYTVTVDTLAGNGTLRLDLKGSGTGIIDGASNPIGAGYNAGPAYTIDHAAPTIASVAAPSNATYKSGDQLDFTVNFNEAVTVNSGGGTPSITVTLGNGATAQAHYLSGSGGSALTFRYIVGAGDIDADGISLASAIALNGGTLKDGAGNDAALTLHGVGALTGILVDGAAPTVASINIAGAATTGASSVDYTVTFSESVTGVDITDFALNKSGNANGTIASITGSGTTYTVTVNTVTGDGALRLDLNGASTGIIDTAGNAIATTGHTGDQAYTLDHTPPAAPGEVRLAAVSDSGTVGDGVTNVAAPVITGTADANATVRLYDTDGTTVLGTATANGAGVWSITSAALSLGAHALTVKQFDLAGNASVSAALALTVEAPPAPPTTPTTPPTTVDGVPVTQQPVTLPGGDTGTQIVVPVVTPGRDESSGDAGVADIPLATSGTADLLLAQVAAGFGLTATGGASQPAGSSTQQLIQAILAATPDHPASDQGHLTGNGVVFLNQLASTVPLLVQTITPTGGATTAGGALTLTGTSTDAQHTALVIDTTNLAPGARLVLNAVDFAAIVGAADVTGNTSGQILTGDLASQKFTVGAGSNSSVFAGGGSDTLVFNTTTSAAGAGAQGATLAAGTTILHGGLGDDAATFNGASADYTVGSHDGYVVVTAKAQPNQHALVINAEMLKFSDTTFTVQNRDALDSITGLYQDVLGRQADYLGVEFWATAEKNGLSLGKIALDLIGSAESQARHAMVFNGDSAHDVELLYQGIFSRSADAGGLTFWVNNMANGLTLEQVAASFLLSEESKVHKIGVQEWDFQMG